MSIWSQTLWSIVLSPCFICNLQTFPRADLYAHRCLWNSCPSYEFGWKQGNIVRRSETAAHQHPLSRSRKLQIEMHRCSCSITRVLQWQSCPTVTESAHDGHLVLCIMWRDTRSGWSRLKGVQHKCNHYICSDRQLSQRISISINIMEQSH